MWKRLLTIQRRNFSVKKPVVIVGSGPVGLVLSILLKQQSPATDVLILEQKSAHQKQQGNFHPQAHFMNLRTMEILYTHTPSLYQRLVRLNAVSSHGKTWKWWQDFVYCSSILDGGEIARVNVLHTDSTKLDKITPVEPVHLPQHVFEKALAEYALEVGVKFKHGHEVLDIKYEGDKFHRKLLCRDIQNNTIESVKCNYLIGADGAHSIIRSKAGIESVGKSNLQNLINIHFHSKELSDLVCKNPAMLYFVYNSDVLGVFIAHNLELGEWVFQIPYFPPVEKLSSFTKAHCTEMINASIGKNRNVKLTIKSIGTWQMSAQIAEKYYCANDHSIFLVGDAAHQFPPAGGFGMNTGIQDAHNLAWKLSCILNQKSPSMSLLKSYDTERRAVAVVNLKLSLENFKRTLRVPEAMQLKYDHIDLVKSIFGYFPSGLQNDLFLKSLAIGKLPLKLLEGNQSKIGKVMKSRIKDIVENRHALGLMFFHFDLGVSYEESWRQAEVLKLLSNKALDQSHMFNSNLSMEKTTEDSIYSQQLRVGSRFPHFWLEFQNAKHSSISLFNSDEYVLFCRHDLLQLLCQGETLLHNIKLVGIHSIEDTEVSRTEQSYCPLDIEYSNLFQDKLDAVLVRPDGHTLHIWAKDELSTASLDIIRKKYFK